MSAVSDSRHFCCVTKQTCLLCQTKDMTAVSQSRHVCLVSVVSYSRHVCCVTHQACLLCQIANMSAMSHRWIPPTSNYLFWASANRQGQQSIVLEIVSNTPSAMFAWWVVWCFIWFWDDDSCRIDPSYVFEFTSGMIICRHDVGQSVALP